MQEQTMPNRISAIIEAARRPKAFLTESTWAQRSGESGIADFTFGNPHEMPLTGVVDALRTWTSPLNRDWFAYKMSIAEAQAAAATSLRNWCGVPFDPADIAMTNGGMAALMVAFKAVTDPGDEVVINTPAWLNYEPMILESGLVPVKVPMTPDTFDLDLDAIERAITPRTRIVLVNTPHNPTGRIFSLEDLQRFGDLLDSASQRLGRAIYILSDEPYNRLVFDGKRSYSPAEVYPRTLLAYSYGKVLLAPGERIGYLAMPPNMPDRDALREAILTTQLVCGWAFPNAILQYALPDLEKLSISVERLERRRDRMMEILTGIGYEAMRPEGTFYISVRSPWQDDNAFTELLTRWDVFVLPGSLQFMPGYFRISLTASDEMIEQAIPGFEAAFEFANANEPTNTLAVADD